MYAYCYQEITRDLTNQVKALVPVWKDVPLSRIMKLGLGSLSEWDDDHLGQYFQESEDELDHDSEGDAPYHFSEMTINVGEEWQNLVSPLIVYKTPGGLVEFLRASWQPAVDAYQKGLHELIQAGSPGKILLEILEKFFHDDFGDYTKRIRRGEGGFVEQAEFQSDFKSVLVGEDRCYFYKRTDGKHIAFKQSYQKKDDFRIPIGIMLWGAEGLKAGEGPFTAFWEGKCQLSNDLYDFDEVFFERIETAALFSSSPWLPLEDECIEVKAVVRIPGKTEAFRWLSGDPEAKPPKHDLDALQSISSVSLPAGLPSAGFIKDSRSPLHIPEDVPLIADVGEALAILSRTDHGLFVSDRAPRLSLRLLPKMKKPLWAVLATPRLPTAEGRS